MKSTTPLDLTFHEQTTTFDLTVTLNQKNLTIILNDYIDWIIYQKEYTDEDMEKQFGKNIKSIDVLSAFTQTQGKSDEEIMRDGEFKGRVCKEYQFGNVVKYGEINCYKIQKQGKITVYASRLEPKTKKSKIYESPLILTKLRNFTQQEKATVISKNKENEQEKKIRQQYEKRISILQQENKKLRNQSAPQKKSQKLEKVKTQKHKKYSDYTNLPQYNSKQSRMQLDRQDKKGLQKYLNINGGKVQYIRYSSDWAQYIFNDPIKYNQTSKFSIKILKVQRKKNVIIGIVDYEQQKTQRDSHDSGNAMCYEDNGTLYPQIIQQGKGYQPGDVVQVLIDRSTATVKYNVNGVLQATHSCKMLDDDSRIFMPYVELKNNESAVLLLLE